MKNLLKFLSLFCFFGLLLACNSKDDDTVVIKEPVIPLEKATVIYVVRHAEKATNHPTDPDLSTAGQARANTLRDSLAKVPMTAIYTTNFKRTRQTAEPTASAKGLTPIVYSPSDLKALADKIRLDNLNETVLVVGHSNTILETVEALGGTRLVASVSESEYNYLFKVTLKENENPAVEVIRYGN